jgi:hypothetical protein
MLYTLSISTAIVFGPREENPATLGAAWLKIASLFRTVPCGDLRIQTQRYQDKVGDLDQMKKEKIVGYFVELT